MRPTLSPRRARGAGVSELIESLLARRGRRPSATSRNHSAVEIGVCPDGRPVMIHPHGGGALIAGLSGGGKSTLATALLERILADGFQVCVFDPEGDYAQLRSAIVEGDAKSRPI